MAAERELGSTCSRRRRRTWRNRGCASAARSEHQRSSSDSQNAFWPLYRSVASFAHSCFGLDREQSATYCSLDARMAFAHSAYSQVSRDALVSPGAGGNGGTDLGSRPQPQPSARQDTTSTVPAAWNRIPKLHERTPPHNAGHHLGLMLQHVIQASGDLVRPAPEQELSSKGVKRWMTRQLPSFRASPPTVLPTRNCAPCCTSRSAPSCSPLAATDAPAASALAASTSTVSTSAPHDSLPNAQGTTGL